jgi:hypothetical protein
MQKKFHGSIVKEYDTEDKSYLVSLLQISG